MKRNIIIFSALHNVTPLLDEGLVSALRLSDAALDSKINLVFSSKCRNDGSSFFHTSRTFDLLPPIEFKVPVSLIVFVSNNGDFETLTNPRTRNSTSSSKALETTC